MNELGLIYLFTGEGKGKTSAALGTALRSLARGWRVTRVSFYKEAGWKVAEAQLETMLLPLWGKNFELLMLGKGFYIKKPPTTLGTGSRRLKIAPVASGVVTDDDSEDEHRRSAQTALATAAKILERSQDRPDVLILDEVTNAVADGLLAESALLDLLRLRDSTHLILTGRNASEKLIKASDLVSRIDKVKHPYDQGKLAVKGLDY